MRAQLVELRGAVTVLQGCDGRRVLVDPHNVMALYNLADASDEIGDYNQGAEYWRAYLAPTVWRARRARAPKTHRQHRLSP